MADRSLEFGIRITGDGKVFLTEKDKVVRGIDDIDKSSKRAAQGVGGLFKSLDGLARVAAGGFIGAQFAQGFMSMGRAVLDAQARIDKFGQTFAVVFGGAAKGARELAYISEAADRLGVDLNSASAAYGKLAASARGTSLEGQKTREIFESVAQAGVKLGLSTQEVDGALLAISQMMSKGTVSAEELRGQLGERLPGAFQVAARAMGVTTAELGEMLQKGQIMAEDFLPKFARQLQEAYAGEAARTAQRSIIDLGNAWERFKRSVAESGLGAATQSALDQMTDVLRKGTSVLDEWKKFGEMSGSAWLQGFLGKAAIFFENNALVPGGAAVGGALRAGSAAAAPGPGYNSPRERSGTIGGIVAEGQAIEGVTKPMKAYLDLVKDLSGVSSDFASKLKVLNDEFLRQGGATNPANLERYRKEVAELIKSETELGKEWAKKLGKKIDLEKMMEAQAKKLREAAAAHMEVYRAAMEAAEGEQEFDEWVRKIERHTTDAELAMLSYVSAIENDLRARERETAAINMTVEQLEAAEIARQAEIRDVRLMTGWGEKAIEIYEREAAAIRNRNAALRTKETQESVRQGLQQMAEEGSRQMEQIGDSLTDALFRGFEAGESFGKNFAETLRNTFRTLVLRPVIQAIMAPVAGGISMLTSGMANAATGMLGGGGAGGFGSLLQSMPMGGIGGSILTGLGQGIMSLGGGAGGFLGGLGGGLTNIAAEGLIAGTLGNLSGGFAALGAGNVLGGLGSLAAGAMPILGIGLMIAAAMGAFSRKGGPKSGGFSSSIPGMERFFTPNDADSAMAKIVAGNEAAYSSTLAALGGTGTARFAFGYDDDPKGSAQSRISAAATVNGRQIYSVRDKDVGRGMEAVEAALELESKRVLLAALQASELPEQIGRVFSQLTAESATAEQIDTLIQFGTAMKGVIDAVSGSAAEDAEKAWQRLTQGATETLREMGREVSDLAKEQDGSVKKMAELAQATAAYRQALTETLLALRQVRESLTELFAGTREEILLGGQTDQFRYDYYRAQASSLLAQLETTTDPAQVESLSQKINDYLLAAFGLLDPEAQNARRQEFLDGLTLLDTAVTRAIQRIGDGILGDSEDPFADVNEALSTAAVDFGAAANTQVSAAAQMESAAARMEAAAGRFEVAVATPIYVSVGEVGR